MSIDRSTIALGAHATAWGALLVTTYLVRTGALGSGATEGLGAILGFAVFAALAAWSAGQLVDRLGRSTPSWGESRPCSHRSIGGVVGGLPLATASQLEASRALGYFGATTITPVGSAGSAGGTAVSSGVACTLRPRRGLTIRRVNDRGVRAGRCGREVG